MNAWVHWNSESLSRNLCCNWQQNKKKIRLNDFYDGFTYASATDVPLVYSLLLFFFFFLGLRSFTDEIHCSFHIFWVIALERRWKKKWEMIKNDVYFLFILIQGQINALTNGSNVHNFFFISCLVHLYHRSWNKIYW